MTDLAKITHQIGWPRVVVDGQCVVTAMGEEFPSWGDRPVVRVSVQFLIHEDEYREIERLQRQRKILSVHLVEE